jgi:drug/metabolite transporter (DMT)-like permease
LNTLNTAFNKPTSQTKTESNIGAHLGLFVTTTIWASTFLNIKIVLDQIPANTLAFLRFLIASCILSLYQYLSHKPLIKTRDLGWVV